MSEADPCRKLSELERRVKVRVRFALSGEKASRFRGLGTEFYGHKKYEYGDDSRHIDWAASLRTGALTKAELQVKTFAQEVGVPCFIVLDASRSMGYEAGKRRLSILAAATVAYFAAQMRDNITLVLVSEKTRVMSASGRRGVYRVLREVCSCRFDGEVTAEMVLRAVRAAVKRRGHTYMISDFIFRDLEKLHAVVEYIRSLGGSYLTLVQVLEKWEEELPEVGYVALADPETGEVSVVDASSRRARERLREAISTVQRSLESMRAAGCSYIRFLGEGSVEELILDYLMARRWLSK